MTEFRRKVLPHQPPWSVDPSAHAFFITICAKDRRNAPLLPMASGLIDAIRFYHAEGIWWTHLAVVMPDHVHLILSFPPDRVFRTSLAKWKHWTAHNHGVDWQRDFFDHRLRREESFNEKADYVLQNPVRAGLVSEWESWPHRWCPSWEEE